MRESSSRTVAGVRARELSGSFSDTRLGGREGGREGRGEGGR